MFICSSTCITICCNSTKSQCPLNWPKWLIPDYYTEVSQVTEEKKTGNFPWHQPAVVRTSTTEPRMAEESGILTAPRTVSTTSPPKPLDSCWMSSKIFKSQLFRKGTVSIHWMGGWMGQLRRVYRQHILDCNLLLKLWHPCPDLDMLHVIEGINWPGRWDFAGKPCEGDRAGGKSVAGPVREACVQITRRMDVRVAVGHLR